MKASLNRKVGLCLAVLLSLSAWARAEGKLWEPAPKITIANFVKGGEVKEFEKGKVYVVEFWATWCGPCRTSIPHLTEIQKRYKDKVVIIGVSDEKLETVKPFVEQMGEKMAYTVCVDQDKQTNKVYMQAFGANTIPHAFIVNGEGKLVWKGHPVVDGMDAVLEKVVAGKFDEATAKKLAQEKLEQQKLVQAAQPVLVKYFQLAASESVIHDDLKNAGEELLKAIEPLKNAQLYNEISWTILTSEQVKQRDKALALNVAELGVKASEGKDAAILDTYARALHDNGKLDEAIVQQKKAIELAKGNAELLAQLKPVLEQYEAEAKK